MPPVGTGDNLIGGSNLQAPIYRPALGRMLLFKVIKLVSVESPHCAFIFKTIGNVPVLLYVIFPGSST